MRKPLSLYVHIPFCVRKCIYCDFLSFGVGQDCEKLKGNERKKYIQALCMEIMSYKKIAHKYMVHTIFIGGGTPSILVSGDISLIIATIRSVFKLSPDAEITIETNPGTIDMEKAKEYIEIGINRISIGLQSTNDEELRMLGRIHNYDQFLASFQIAREAGFQNINVDIMSAIPGQTLHSYLETVEKVLKCNPEHISSYSLIVEEGTPLSQDEELLAKLPDEIAERKMYDATNVLLSAAGYHRYEISNYAKPGVECRHNKVYWSLGEYIGFGIGAASFFERRRFSNTRDFQLYTDTIYHSVSETQHTEKRLDVLKKIQNKDEEINTERLMEEFMFLGLRMMEGVSAETFYTYFGQSIYEIYGDVIEKYVKEGMIKDDGGLISLTNRGIDVSNVILADFLLDP